MPHKANSSFFDYKRPWSKRKDLILSYYLTPYITKIATQKRPVLIVDGFAGPGRFEDGDIGSPLIIATKLKSAIEKGLGVDASLLAIESSRPEFDKLKVNLAGFNFASARYGTFLESIEEIRSLSMNHSVFLYVDPWAIEGLDWAALDSIFEMLNAGSSIELLLNFNVQAFARRGRAALQLSKPENPDDIEGNDEEWERAINNLVEADRLDAVAGGDWWRNILAQQKDFVSELKLLTDGLCERLRCRFREVFTHTIKAKESHTTPKYVLVFCSRSDHALPLINDASVRSLEMYADEHRPDTPMLFETLSQTIVPDVSEIYPAIRMNAPEKSNAMPRRSLAIAVIRDLPGRHLLSTINKAIGEMLKNGQLQSETGKTRINDRVRVWKT